MAAVAEAPIVVAEASIALSPAIKDEEEVVEGFLFTATSCTATAPV